MPKAKPRSAGKPSPTRSAATRSRRKRTASSKKRPVRPDDLYRFQVVSDAQISPDGTSVLFTHKRIGERNQYETSLWIVPVDGGTARPFTTGTKDAQGRWSPDGSRVAFISEREEGRPQIHLMPTAGGEATPLTNFPEGRIARFAWSPDGTTLAVSFMQTDPERTREAARRREETGASTPPWVIEDLFYRLDGTGYINDRRYAVYVVDVATGQHRLLFDRDRFTGPGFAWSPDSTELVVTANTDPRAAQRTWKQAIFRIDVARGRAVRLRQVPDGKKAGICWSPDGEVIAWAGWQGRQIWGSRNALLFVSDPQTGATRCLSEDWDRCLSATTLSDLAEAAFEPNIQFTPDGKRIVMAIGWHGQRHVASVDRRGGTPVMHTSGRKSFEPGNISCNGRAMAMTVGDALAPPEVAVGRFTPRGGTKAMAVKMLTALNRPLLDELELSAPEPCWVHSEDGTRVHTWVVKPVGFREGRRYPAVLEIHGGPHAQYGEAFFHEMQVLASAGYVVVFSNPRGSKGYGEAFCDCIRGAWGDRDWHDVQAVIAHMKNLPFVDQRRMGVMGGSYGGYMTNWVISHTNDFAAAITDRCVSNLVSMAGTSDFPLVPDDYWPGNPWDRPETLWEQSPIRHFGNVQTPTLVIHSEGDLRCNIEQGEQVFAALKLRGIPAKFVRYPVETSHGMSRMGPPDLRLHRLEQILSWWKQYLK